MSVSTRLTGACLTVLLAIASPAGRAQALQAEATGIEAPATPPFSTAFVNAEKMLDLAASSHKKLRWITIWVPSCATAESSLKEYVQIAGRNRDVELLLVCVNRNEERFRYFSERYLNTFYVIDPVQYGKDMERHFRFMHDLCGRLGMRKQFFAHLLLDAQGHVVYAGKELSRRFYRLLGIAPL